MSTKRLTLTILLAIVLVGWLAFLRAGLNPQSSAEGGPALQLSETLESSAEEP